MSKIDPMSKLDIVFGVVSDLWYKLRFVLGSVVGWAMMFMTYSYNVFGPKAELIHWVLIALLVDLIFGMVSAARRKQFHISTALWSTAFKLVMYITLFYMPMILEKIVHEDTSFCTIAVTALLVSAEFFSCIAHMLIIKPNLLGAKLIFRLLSGEVAKKLDMPVAEVEKMFFQTHSGE